LDEADLRCSFGFSLGIICVGGREVSHALSDTVFAGCSALRVVAVVFSSEPVGEVLLLLD